MSQYVDNFIKQHKEYFNRNKVVIETNEWNKNDKFDLKIKEYSENLLSIKNNNYEDSEKDLQDLEKNILKFTQNFAKTKAALFKQENDLTNSIVGRITSFIKEVEKSGDRKETKVQKFIDNTVGIINVHIKKCNEYLNYSLDNLNQDVVEDDVEFRTNEILFQDNIFSQKIKIQEILENLNISGDVENNVIRFFEDRKASLPMIDVLPFINPDIKDLTDKLKLKRVISDKEFYIHKRDRGDIIPKWEEKKHYWEQKPDVLKFWWNEWMKITLGFEIDGYFIHPWLYYHLNFYKTPIPQADGSEPIISPYLRDNEWYISELLKKADKKKDRGILLFGSRRFSKSVGMSSICDWKALTKANASTSIKSGSAGDLSELTSKIETSMNYMESAFKMHTPKGDWDKEVIIGLKPDANNTIIHSRHLIKNLDSGAKSATQKTAGGAPSVSLYEEIGKASWIKAYRAELPAFQTEFGWKTTVIGVGCVCAGTKVWNNFGKLISIEDLKKEEGIIGFDIKNDEISKEDISYWQEPHEKVCYRLETNKGRILECSEDHPILIRDKWANHNRVNFKKTQSFIEIKDIEVGDSLCVVERVNIWGKQRMFDPRLIGWLVGDGSYGFKQSARLMNADESILSYVHKNYKTSVYFSAPTKDGRVLEKINISGILPELRKLEIYGQTKDNKRLPKNIEAYNKKDVCEFIGGYYDADGCIYTNNKSGETFIKLTSANEFIIREMQILLQKLGIHGNVMYGKMSISDKSTRGHYDLIIKDKKSILEFYKNIKFSIVKKQENFKRGVLNLKNKKGRNVRGFEGMRFERVTSIENIGIKPVYNLTAEKTNTYIANGIITHNTSGEVSLTGDAMQAVTNPESLFFMEMDWDMFEKVLPLNFEPTWKRRTFASFVPGQMAYYTGFKRIERGFGEFLGIKSKELDKIRILQTDWINNTEVLRRDRKLLEKDAFGLQQLTVFYPLDPEECFLSPDKNPLPYLEAKRQKEKIILEGDTGRQCYLSKDQTGRIIADFDLNKKVAEYPHTGGFIDSPILLFEELPENRPPYYLYAAGFDDYKQDESDNSESVGTLYIYKRNLPGVKNGGQIVASMSTRPDPHTKMHKQWKLLLEAFNCQAFGENEDMDFKKFLDNQRLTNIFLTPSMDFESSEQVKYGGTRKYGWQPTPKNKKFLFGLFMDFCWAPFTITDENDNEIELIGVQLIKDVALLDEIINYSKEKNVDRITAMMGALGLDFKYFLEYLFPKVNHNQREEQQKTNKKPSQNLAQKMFKTTGKMNHFRQ